MANSSPEKMELKRGPWSHQEDQILISYVEKNGHGNWRALPEKAGLLRCGKSCRLRWTNYLRPDIKRGKLSQEEEETIFRLHEVLGNRWSAIAAQLPGRTDNEIKNLWNAHLKKRLKTSTIPTPESNSKVIENSNSTVSIVRSPQECSSSGISTVTNSLTDESLWMERLTNEDATCWKADESGNVDRKLQFPVEEDGTDFWFDLLVNVGDMKEMPKF